MDTYRWGSLKNMNKFILFLFLSSSVFAETLYTLPTKSGPVKIILESKQKALKLHRNNKYNCFALASGTGRHTPGNPKTGPLAVGNPVTFEAIKLALKDEGAVDLGLDHKSASPYNDRNYRNDRKYYLIAAFFMTGEYHFVRLFEDGWWSKPSKVGMGFKMTDFLLPTLATFARINKSPLGRRYRPVGYYLFPVSPKNLE